MCYVVFFSALTAYTESQNPITIRASVFPHPVVYGVYMSMQCAYTVDTQQRLTLHWFKKTALNDVLIWTADTSGQNAAESNNVYLESAYSLSNGHAIRLYFYNQSQQGFYYCIISIRTFLGEDYHVSSNLIQIETTGSDIFLNDIKIIS